MTRERKLEIKDLHREVCALQQVLAGKVPPHGQKVADANGYYKRTKWPSNFNKADRALQRQFQYLIDCKRQISELERAK